MSVSWPMQWHKVSRCTELWVGECGMPQTTVPPHPPMWVQCVSCPRNSMHFTGPKGSLSCCFLYNALPCTQTVPPSIQPLIWTCQSHPPHNVTMIMVHRQEGPQPAECVSCWRAPQDHRQSTSFPLWDISWETKMPTTVWMSCGDRWVSWQSVHPIRDLQHCAKWVGQVTGHFSFKS